jgi:hypothetical protein
MQYRVGRNIPTIAIVLGVFTVTSMVLMASTNRAYPNLNVALDMGMLLIVAILGSLYWDKNRRADGKVSARLAVCFGLVGLFGLVNGMVTVEWSGHLRRFRLRSYGSNLLPGRPQPICFLSGWVRLRTGARVPDRQRWLFVDLEARLVAAWRSRVFAGYSIQGPTLSRSDRSTKNEIAKFATSVTECPQVPSLRIRGKRTRRHYALPSILNRQPAALRKSMTYNQGG